MTQQKRPVGRPKAQPTAVIRIRLPIALHAQVIELGGDIFVKRVIREAVEATTCAAPGA